MKILIAEDDASVAFILQLSLESLGGHRVEIVNDGKAAVESALKDEFDLILLDGMMPKLSGLQAAAAIRSGGEKKTPIIFLSARNDDQEINQFLKVGNGYLAKPFDPQTICSAIETELKRIQNSETAGQ